MKRWIIIVAAVVVIIAGVWWYRRSRQPKEPEEQIATAAVERGDLRVAVSATGVLEPLTTVDVKSRSGGEISRMLVEAGDVVKAGQLLAQLDPTELQSQVDQASAAVRSATARVDQAKYSAQAQTVQTSTGVEEARAALDSARVRLKQSEAQLEQTRRTSEDQVVQAQASLKSARARLSQAEQQAKVEPALAASQVRQAQASLDRAKQDLAALLAGARPQEIAQAEARVAEAQAVAQNAQTELQRQQRLLTKGFVSQQDVDSAQRTYDTANAQLASARQALSLTKEGARSEDIRSARAAVDQAQAALESARTNQVSVSLRESDRDAAQAAVTQAEAALATAEAGRKDVTLRQGDVEAAKRTLDQAEASLRRAESGTLTDAAQQQNIKTAMADLARAQSQLDDVEYSFNNTNIVAPRSGVVLQKYVEEGTVIPAGTAALAQGTAIVTIADITKMYVLADVDEVDISRVALGQPAEIKVETLPNTVIPGSVEKIFPRGTEESNVVYFQVRIRITKLDPRLRPGMTADVSILTAQRKNVLLVPDAAVDRSGGKTTVQVLEQEGAEPVEREVKVGVTDYTNTEIISGLSEGDEVVLPPAAPTTNNDGPGRQARTPEEERARTARRATRIIGHAQGR